MAEKRLYAGDQISIGAFTLLFLSDAPADRPVKSSSLSEIPRRYLVYAGSVLGLLLILFLFHAFVYTPWSFNRDLKEARHYMEQGEPELAVNLLEGMLKDDISSEKVEKINALLTKSVVLRSKQLAEAGDIEGAKRELKHFLKSHGEAQASKPAWNALDLYRIQNGKKLAANGQFLKALREFAAIDDDSPYFDTAQQETVRIWLEYQKEQLNKQTVRQLIQEGEKAFQEKRYVAPMNHNAYAAFQVVLSIDPSNQLARDRIAEIKKILKQQGMNAYRKKRYRQALNYFEQYTFIAPDDKEVRKLISRCRQRLSPPKRKKKRVDRNREKVQKLLKNSGAQSPWVMKYLFEEDRKKSKETPW